MIAGMAVASCEFMFEETRSYVLQRKAFGKTIAHLQVCAVFVTAANNSGFGSRSNFFLLHLFFLHRQFSTSLQSLRLRSVLPEPL